jgi:hypothetical protein
MTLSDSHILTPPALWLQLQERYPWPGERPDVKPIDWSVDYGGRDLITNLIARRKLRMVLELGVFLGGSARQWLMASPDVLVVAVDPWPEITSATHQFYFNHPIGRRHWDQLTAPHGGYRTFLSSLWNLRQRIVPVRAGSMTVLPELHALGLRPDLVYLDTDKTGQEISLCEALFPEALISGDDWYWQDGRQFPIRVPVTESCRRRGYHQKQVDNTWLIDSHPWTWQERLIRLRSVPKELFHRLDVVRQQMGGVNSGGGSAGDTTTQE